MDLSRVIVYSRVLLIQANEQSTILIITISDRGYDFMGVTKWMAEKADVILFFFDPDKPGTTGETLQALTQALQGQDSKLHIILNKVDQFSKVHDFGRAYGALSWNLAKIIHRKDMPEIHTICVPHDENMNEPASPCIPLDDLKQNRKKVLEIVFNAPAARLDNMITQVSYSTQKLLLHSRLINAIKKQLSKQERSKWLNSVCLTMFGGAVTAGLYAMGVDSSAMSMMGVASLVSGGGLFAFEDMK